LIHYCGKYQLTETESMVAKLPVLRGKTDTVTMMAHGFDPYLSSWSPYHGAIYAVVESMAKIVASGGDHKKIRFTFQEYFRRMTGDPSRWSQPFAALLGAYDAQIGFGLPSIGGKDSMSGTFNDIDVPPTLVSFAVDVAKSGDIITPELKQPGNVLVRFKIEKDDFDIPMYDDVANLYDFISGLMQEKAVVSAYAADARGVAAALSKMAFGNKLGVKIADEVTTDDLFENALGDIVAEVSPEKLSVLTDSEFDVTVIGTVTEAAEFVMGDVQITMEEALDAWTSKLEKVFPTKAVQNRDAVESGCYKTESVYICKHKTAKPTVFIPVFPGTNCEYDSAKAFERAGANVITKVFKNLTAQDIRNSVEEYEKAIAQAQICIL
ncbi:MAG: phosphoribosylformylglycinamidine synthase subunit PurQ, partial [Acetatifactor sp.]|nr:phosphoribosylformylglycinamidine synthase subunit PurQ [Acetatifactor sp.]